MIGLAEIEIERIDWSAYHELSGNAASVGLRLKALLRASTPGEADATYWQLENHIVVQGSVFSAAEPAVSVLVASLADDRASHVRISVLELLFQILNGAPDQSEMARGNGGLMERCRVRAREGLWLLAREMLAGEREAAQYVLDLIDEERSAAYGAWLDSDGSSA